MTHDDEATRSCFAKRWSLANPSSNWTSEAKRRPFYVKPILFLCSLSFSMRTKCGKVKRFPSVHVTKP